MTRKREPSDQPQLTLLAPVEETVVTCDTSVTPSPRTLSEALRAAPYPLSPSGPIENEHGYLSRAFIQVTLPHRKPAGPEFVRQNGHLYLSLLAPASVGLPYGSIPRLVLIYLTSQATILRSPAFAFPGSFSNFLSRIGVHTSSNSAKTARKQIESLLSTTINILYRPDPNQRPALPTDPDTRIAAAGAGFRIASEYQLWWNSKSKEHQFVLRLSEDCYHHLTTGRTPLDTRVLNKLRWPLALDIYAWLSYREHRDATLQHKEFVSWDTLQAQFGSEYRSTAEFARNFRASLRRVVEHYPQARITPIHGGISLHPRTNLRRFFVERPSLPLVSTILE